MLLRDLMELALEAHAGQVDKANKSYILHPWSVSLLIRSKVAKLPVFSGVTEDLLISAEKAAVAHDLIEDTWVTLDFLASRGLEPLVLDALDLLTRKSDQSYEDFVVGCMKNPVSHMVKVADLVENLNPNRIRRDMKSDVDIKREEKYRKMLLKLGVLESELSWLLQYY